MRKFKDLLKGGKKKKRDSTFHVRRRDEKQPRAVTRNTYRCDAFGPHTRIHARCYLQPCGTNHSGPLEWLIVFTVIHLFPPFIFRFNLSSLSSTSRRNFTSFLSALTIIHSCHSCHSCHSYVHALIRLRDINYFPCFNVNAWC